MKLVLIATAMFLGTIASADLGSRTYEANLKTINLDKNLSYEFGNIDVDGGTITLDYARKEARLTLYRRYHCPPNALCALVMPAPIVIKLPIKSQATDHCGSKIITAYDFPTNFAGRISPNSKTIRVVDNRGNRCPTFVALEPTEVVLETGYNVVLAPMFFRVHTTSTMTGDKLIRTDDQL